MIGCIIQARTTSTRLPNKVLKHLPYNSETTVLEQVVKRVKASKLIDLVIIATTENATDDPIVQLCNENNILVFRGNEDNVLSRYYGAAKMYNLKTIIRITSDCPCIDSNIIDLMIKKFEDEKYDYLSNVGNRTFPHGLDVEIFTFDALEEAYKKATKQIEFEHVTQYICNTHKDDFKIGNYQNATDLSNIRITLDTEKDYALLCQIYDYLYDSNPNFCLQDIQKLFANKPWLYIINGDIMQKKVCNNLNEELNEALNILKRQDLTNAANFVERIINEKNSDIN